MISSVLLIQAMRGAGLRLSETYPYAFKVGGFIKEVNPEWWQAFCEEKPHKATWPLDQARDFAFLEYLEEKAQADEIINTELITVFEEFFIGASPHLQQELENTITWYIERRT